MNEKELMVVVGGWSQNGSACITLHGAFIDLLITSEQ